VENADISVQIHGVERERLLALEQSLCLTGAHESAINFIINYAYRKFLGENPSAADIPDELMPIIS